MVVILVLSLEVIEFVVILGWFLENSFRMEKVFRIDLFNGVFIFVIFFFWFYIMGFKICFDNYCLMKV